MDKILQNGQDTDKSRLLVFMLASRNFGIELHKIKEITDLLPTTRLPGAHRFVKGLGNLRGEIIPIISLRERLNIHGDEKGKQIIIVISKKVNYGLLVDKIQGIYAVDTRGSESISSIFSQDAETSFLIGVCKVENSDVILLDSEKLIEIN